MIRISHFSFLVALAAVAASLAGCFGGPGADSAFDDPCSSSNFSCFLSAETTADPATALGMYQKACAMGNEHACRTLGRGYREGALVSEENGSRRPIARDPAKALKAYQHACDLSAERGCVPLAELVESGEAPGESDATPYYEKACRGEAFTQVDVCGKAADGYTAKKNDATALELRRIGCQKKQKGCAAVGRAEIAAGDATKGQNYLKNACFYEKDADACFEHAAAEELAGGRDALYDYEDACKYGRKDACAKVETVRKKERAADDARWEQERAEREKQWAAEQREAARADATSDASSKSSAAASSSTASSGGGDVTSSISMNDAHTGGVHAAELSCKLAHGGLMDSFILLGVLGERKRALAACGVGKGKPFHVEWTMRGGAVTASKASGTGAHDACIANAMQQLKQNFTGTCAGTLDLEN